MTNSNKVTAVNVLGTAAKENIVGRFLKEKRNGLQVREYTINGKSYKVEAWPTEHTF